MLRWLNNERGAILGSLFFAVCCCWCVNAIWNSNAQPRVALAQSIVTRGSLTINDVAPYTIDKSKYDGNYYCDKAPGVSLLCVPGAAVANGLADALGADRTLINPAGRGVARLRYPLVALACFASSTLLWSTLAFFLFGDALRALGVETQTRAIGLIGFGFGSPFFIWSTTLFGHAPTASLLFIPFALSRLRAAEPLLRSYALWGFLLALAMLVDTSAAPAGMFIALFLLLERGTQALITRGTAMFAGALPIGLLFLCYNYAAFGSPFHLGYASVDGWHGMQSGLFGVTAPSWQAFSGILVSSYRGIIWISPISFLAIVSLLLPWPREYRSTFIVAAVVTVYYVFLNSSYFYWDGGLSLGPRHLTPAIPYAMFALTLRLRNANRIFQLIIGALVVVSVMLTLTSASILVEVPDDGRPTLLAHILPLLREGQSSLLLAKAGVPFWALLTVPWLLALAAAYAIATSGTQDQSTTGAAAVRRLAR